jgi:SAM-dependent methyltransferase
MAPGKESDREHWNERYTERPWPTEPSPWLIANARFLTPAGRALDVAGGSGRNAIWLASLGWDVTITDVSSVAIDLAVTRARSLDITLGTLETDLAQGDLPPGPWDAIMLFHYLDRALFRSFSGLLEPGGIVIGSLATVTNLERNNRPPPPYLLDEGELPRLIQGLELVEYDESWKNDHHDARFVARRQAHG